MKKSEKDKIRKLMEKDVAKCCDLIIDLLDTWSFSRGVVMSTYSTLLVSCAYNCGMSEEDFKEIMQYTLEKGLEHIKERDKC